MKAIREVTIAFERCRRPHCNREAVSRGLCASDYQQAWRYVSAGSVTWEELENRGKVNEPARGVKAWLFSKG
jgi:hypothetical protein